MPVPPGVPAPMEDPSTVAESNSPKKSKKKAKSSNQKTDNKSSPSRPSITLLLFDLLVFGGAVTLTILIFLKS
jgi:hypothetical protein